MRPRLAILIGIMWVIDVAIYYAFPYVFGGHIDYAGITMLLALSVAMTIMFYVLLAGSPRDPVVHSGQGAHLPRTDAGPDTGSHH